MSVWSGAESAIPSLSTNEGDLVSICLNVEPRELESLLESLARLDFPINPQIYHDAAVVYVYAGGNEETHPATLVEFPAYAVHVPQVRAVLAASGFDSSIVSVAGMWDAMHIDGIAEPAPPGAPYESRRRVRRRAAAAA
jgi:hypothetical protein